MSEPVGLDAFLAEGADRAPAAAHAAPKAPAEPAGLDAFLSEEPANPADPNEPAGIDEFLTGGKYSSPDQQAIAAVEGLARGATLGGSDVAARALGISTPEAMAGRMRENPWTSGLSSAAGATGLASITGGGSLIAEGLGGGVLGGAIGLGTEGAIFGAGNAVTDAALGDPDLNAQKVLSHIGWGAAGGAGLGALAGKLGAFAPRAIEGQRG
jgi:hypothetical protein